jgi:hypothetical protein
MPGRRLIGTFEDRAVVPSVESARTGGARRIIRHVVRRWRVGGAALASRLGDPNDSGFLRCVAESRSAV